MNTPYRLVFFGTETFSVPALEALIANDFCIVGIVTKPDSLKGRGQKKYSNPIKQIGEHHNIPVFQPEKLNSIETELRSLKADAGILVSYGKIISSRILSVFEPTGIINIHPSKLPRFRGPSPIEATILSGETDATISIMKLDEGMDTGPIFLQQSYPLSGKETKPELIDLLSRKGAELLTKHLRDILTGKIISIPQENNDVSVTSLILKADGVLRPTTDNSTVLERKVRAYQGYPKPHLLILENDVIVTSASVVENDYNQHLIIPCADNTWLRIDSLIAPSGRSMSGDAFLRGYTHRPKT